MKKFAMLVLIVVLFNLFGCTQDVAEYNLDPEINPLVTVPPIEVDEKFYASGNMYPVKDGYYAVNVRSSSWDKDSQLPGFEALVIPPLRFNSGEKVRVYQVECPAPDHVIFVAH